MLSGSMGLIVRLAPVVVIALIAVGCIQLEQTVLLNGDGSLAVTCHYSVAAGSEALLATGARVIQQWQGRPAETPAWFANEEAVREHFAATGVTVQRYRRYQSGGRHHVELILFAEYGPAALNSGLLGPLRCDRLADGSVRLWADLPRPAGAAGGLDPRALRALTQDLVLRLDLRVPGSIVSTTAPRHSRSTATWVFDPGVDDAFLNAVPRLECAFDARRLDWSQRLPAAAP